jgi:hypothetical protein
MANAPPTRAQAAPLKDNPDAIEIYADGVAGYLYQNGIFKLTLATVRVDHTKEPPAQHRAVVARLALPFAGAVELQSVLTGAIKELEAKGLIQKQTPK